MKVLYKALFWSLLLSVFTSGCAMKIHRDPITYQTIDSAALGTKSDQATEPEKLVPPAVQTQEEIFIEDSPGYPEEKFQEEIVEEDLAVLGYKLNVLVDSAQVRFVEVTNMGEIPIETFPAWTAGKEFDHEIPYGRKIPISHAVINPSWRPTEKMIKDQKKDIENGKKIPPSKIYRPYKSGEKGNPLGRLAFYLDNKYVGIPLRLHDSPNIPKNPRISKDGKPRGDRISRGCARMNLKTLLAVAEETTKKEREELEALVKSKKPHRIDFKLPIIVEFIRG